MPDPISTPAGTVDGEAIIQEAIVEIPALQAQVTKLNAALAALNNAAATAPVTSNSPELNVVNQELLQLNAVLGTPVNPVPNAAPIPPVSTPVSTPASATQPAPTGAGTPTPDAGSSTPSDDTTAAGTDSDSSGTSTAPDPTTSTPPASGS